MPKCLDPVILNQWHAICAIDEITPNTVYETVLLEEALSFAVDGAGEVLAWRSHSAWPGGTKLDPALVRDRLPARSSYGYLRTSLGTPPSDIFLIPEYFESERRNLNAATIGVHVSAPRAIENFLDMGHFPHVHTGILGAEPHTEVRE
jgi:phenylpropionate dioxygenase-like ring-hydroxylating dioxygenase large terminal subunit